MSSASADMEQISSDLVVSDSSPQDIVELVSRRKLSVDELPLAELSERILQRVRDEEDLDLQATGDALVAVARLMLLKSMHLLVQPEQPEEIEEIGLSPEDDGWRRMVRGQVDHVASREGAESYPAAPREIGVERRFAPRSPSILVRSWAAITDRNGESSRLVTVPSFVRLEVAMSRLIRSIRSSSRFSLRRLLQRGGRNDAVMHFLAVLELLRRRQVTVTQHALFEDITVELAESETSASWRAG